MASSESTIGRTNEDAFTQLMNLLSKLAQPHNDEVSTALMRRAVSKLEGALESEVEASHLCEEAWPELHQRLREVGYVLLSVDADGEKGMEDPTQRVVREAMRDGMAFEPGELDEYSGENGDLFAGAGQTVRRLLRGERQESCWCMMNALGFKPSTDLLADNSVNPLTKLIGEYYRISGVTDFVTASMTDETLLRCWSGYAIEPDDDGDLKGRLVVPRAYYHVLTVVNVLDEDMVVRISPVKVEAGLLEREIRIRKGEVLAVTSKYSAFTVSGGGVYSCFTWPAKAYHTAEELNLDVTLYRSAAPGGLYQKSEEGPPSPPSYAFVSLYYAPDGGEGWWEDGPDVVRSLQRLGRSLGEHCAGIPRVLLVAVHCGEDVEDELKKPFEGCWDRIIPAPRIYRNRWRFGGPHPKANPVDTELTLRPEQASQRCFDTSYPRSFGELTMLEALRLVEFDKIAYIHPNVEVRSSKFSTVFTASATVPAVAVSGISGRAKLSPRAANGHEYRHMGVMVFEPSPGDAYRLKYIIGECEHPAEVPSSNPAADLLTRYWATASYTGVAVLPDIFVGEPSDDSEDEFYDELEDGGSDVSSPALDGEGFSSFLMYKLYYFAGRGRGESVRFALALAGVEYENVFIRTRKDMLDLIPRSTYGQAPLLETPEGECLVQTGAILRYIARKFDLYGKAEGKEERVDEIIEASSDAMGSGLLKAPFFVRDGMSLPDSLARGKAAYRWFRAWEKQIEAGKFIAGNHEVLAPTVADSCALRVVEDCVEYFGVEDVLGGLPNLRAWRDKFLNVPAMVAFMKSSSRMPSPKVEETSRVYSREVGDALGWKEPY
ncbi:Glutathione S-transferase A4 [Perkinsus olseni]|uniref:Glutathione S-transferase A4 n=1 Tax=Perkinsus olseni TaxID=32597 RepID=A0A7J6PCE3_PEROL|nr:Glutathione S-transferase A4 [Perkinsus olseni]